MAIVGIDALMGKLAAQRHTLEHLQPVGRPIKTEVVEPTKFIAPAPKPKGKVAWTDEMRKAQAERLRRRWRTAAGRRQFLAARKKRAKT